MNHVTKLEIRNFKSIKEITMDARRVNVFIGEPNSGKTNIIEALSFFSSGVIDNNFKELIRHTKLPDLFYDNDISQSVLISTNLKQFNLHFAKSEMGAILNQYQIEIENLYDPEKGKKAKVIFHSAGGRTNWTGDTINSNFMTYSYKKLYEFSQSFQPFLSPPYGSNLPQLLMTNSKLKKWVSDFFKEKGFRLSLNQSENKLEMVKDVDDVLYPYPFVTISETMQRIVLLLLAIESNENSILILDEPEANTFPFYTKHFGERIARDKTNQYFLTTHNPYLLLNLIENTPSDELNVIYTSMKDFQTNIQVLNQSQIVAIQDKGADIFFNFEIF